MKLPSLPQSKRPLWQFLLPPMLLLSLGLHGLVLFVPMAPSEEDLVPPPDAEEDGIAITKVDPPGVSRPSLLTESPTSVQATPNSLPGGSGNGASASSRPPQRAAANRPSDPNRTPSTTSGRRPRAAGTRQSDPPETSATTPNPTVTVPDLRPDPQANPAGSTVDNPNPSAPTVEARSQANRTQFLSYTDIFSTYQGLQLNTPEETAERRNLWLRSFTDQGGEYAGLEIQPLTLPDPIPYESGICLPGSPNTAQMLVLVEADGTLNKDIMTLQSTGYRKFNQAAQRLVETHSFAEAAQPQAYLVDVAVDYDEADCEWPPAFAALPDEYFALLDSYRGPELTTLAEAEEAQADWLTTLTAADRITTAEANELEGFQAQVSYPDNICLPIEPAETRWGVVVDAEGTIQGEAKQLRSTGYGVFDDRAQAIVEGIDFPEAESPQAYVITIPTGYNRTNCQKLSSERFELTDQASTAGDRRNAPSAARGSEPAAAATGAAFDPDQQAAIIAAGRQAAEDDPLGALNNDPGLALAVLDSGWPESIDRACFLAESDASDLVPAEGAADVVILSQNTERAPETVAAFYGAEPSPAGDYCGAPLYELKVQGVSQLLASLVGFGAGNSNTLLVLWQTDPR